ncbi:MAG: cellulase family glycosylhydrolase [Geminicoccaceae bacterium]|nr:cellulase family glycosylhydrolase [Geminicoccaceae bacterium]
MTDRRRLLAGAGALCLSPILNAGAGALEGKAAPSPAVPIPALRHGVNLSAWLQLDRRQPCGPADFATIWEAGFDHVRVCVDFSTLGWRVDDPLDVPGIGDLDRAIAMASEAGLAAILDCHGNHDFHRCLEASPAAGDALVGLWRSLAERYADVPAERLAFELLNEPQYYESPADAWPRLQARVLRVVREAAPPRAVLVTGRYGGGIEGLSELTLEGLGDGRDGLIGVFHYYQPYVVTHQGANWGFAGTGIPLLRRVPYPPARFDEAPPTIVTGPDQAAARRTLADYAWSDWGADRIAAEIAVAAAWGRRTGLPLLCSEFGVYRPFAPSEDRWHWIRDVRTALEGEGIGWTVWDYADDFGIAVVEGDTPATWRERHRSPPPNRRRVLAPEASDALDLRGRLS